VISVLNQFFFLNDDCVLVNGIKNSVIINFKNQEIFRANNFSKRIIELGETGYRLSEVSKLLELEVIDLQTFIKELAEKNLIRFSSKPKIDKTIEKSSPKLDFLWMEVTSQCNLRCSHCYADARPKQYDDPSTDEIKKWIDEVADLGCKKVQFTGGECTIRNDLRELIAYAKEKGFDTIEVFTNGTLLTETLIQYFSQNGINVALSLYSYRSETHEAITGIPGSFAKTLGSIKLLLAYEVPIRCAVIAMKQNEDELDGTCHFLNEMGIYSKPPDPIRPIGRGIDKENWPSKYGLRSIQTNPDFSVDRKIYEQSLFWNNCWFGKITITNDGNVLPCVFARDQIAGNVRKKALSQIINEDMIKFWGLNKDKVKVCKDCEYRYLCHECRPWAYGFTGDIYAKSPRCTYDPYNGKWNKADEALSLNNLA
jgi:radical SAM protein with 4Fe4S-binding SPASM domain